MKKNKMITNKFFTTRGNSGSSLIELILYIAILAFFLVGMVNFIWDVIYGREKAEVQQAVEQSARIIISRINYEMHRASNFYVINGEEVQFISAQGTTTISLNGDALQIITPTGGPYSLTSNQVKVVNLNFTDLGNIDSKQLGIELSLSQAQTGSSAFEAGIELSQSVELNTSFNQSRNLLVDFTNVAASANSKSIEGIVMENTGSVDITIDKIELSWTNTVGGENITEVIVNGSSLWSGNQASGSTIDLTDYVLSSVAGFVDLTSLDFDSKIDGGDFSLNFLLADGSTTKTFFSIATSSGGQPSPSPSLIPSPVPSPSPTPTVIPSPSPTTCAQYCQSFAYSNGTCRKNANSCNKSGEDYLPGGNYLCTGGPTTDTCCCAL